MVTRTGTPISEFPLEHLYPMITEQTRWFSFTRPGGTALQCAACGATFDLECPTADHHPRQCPVCQTESVFLNWKDRLIQIVLNRAPVPLVAAIHWAQQNLDELEYVELLTALDALAGQMEASTDGTNKPQTLENVER